MRRYERETRLRPARVGRPRLLVLTSTFPRWQGDATPTFVAELCEALTASFDVTVLAPASAGAAASERWGALNVRRYRYGWPERSQQLADGAILPNLRRNRLLLGQVPLLVLGQLWTAWQLARRQPFDVVHAHWALPQGWVAAMLRRRLGLPVITTTHGADLYALRSGLPLRAKRWALRESDRVAAVSSSLKREVLALGVDERRVRVLPMGVDTTRFTPKARSRRVRRALNPEGPVLLFVGRLVEKKGARYAIEALRIVLRKQPEARLIMVGDGPQRAALLRLSERLGLEGRVRFVGAVPHDELPAYFASADAFVGPSVVESNGDTESFGLVFAEAMASGCPLVTTDVGGIGDLVVDGRTGLVVPQRDAAAVGAALLSLLQDETLRRRLRRNGTARVRERFDLSKTATGYAELMDEVLAA